MTSRSNGIQEGASGIPEQSSMNPEHDSMRLRTNCPIEGPTASIRSNPRQGLQKQMMNIKDKNVTNYFAAVDWM